MAKILFVHPLFLSKNANEQDAASPYFPLGLLYLAAYVREVGHDVAVFDGTFEPDESTFDAALQREQPDVVGISGVAPTRDMALQLARTSAEAGALVVVGGPDVTSSPVTYLAEPAIDVAVHHEGEQTIARLLDLYSAGGLTVDALADEPGVAFRAAGRVVVNDPRPPIENLDDLPLPARDLIDVSRYLELWQETAGYSSITISTSRGCPFGCRWCRDSVHGTGFRQRSPGSVAAEVKSLKNSFAIDRLRVVDDVDAIERSWLEAWAIAASADDAVIPFEALNDLERHDIPMLEMRDSL